MNNTDQKMFKQMNNIAKILVNIFYKFNLIYAKNQTSRYHNLFIETENIYRYSH